MEIDRSTRSCAHRPRGSRIHPRIPLEGVPLAQLDGLAAASITFETSKAAALSVTAGLPGGFAMFATVPGDITQYYVHAFRVMQKLA